MGAEPITRRNEDTPMDTSHSLSRFAEGIERAERHWSAHHKEPAEGPAGSGPAPTITLAREAGCPGTSLARELGARLGWPVYDHELLEHIAREMGLRVKLVESVDEKRQSWLEEAAESLSSAPGVSENAYVRYLMETVLSLGAHGRCVIVGRGAGHILPPETTLRVRLVGDRDDRVQALARRLGLSRDEAARRVEETDRERVRFVKDHFQKDPTDPHQYDLVLNTSRWSVPECADIVLAVLDRLQRRTAGREPQRAMV
jgi:cytidylate kinase